jgi:LysM repeat protein
VTEPSEGGSNGDEPVSDEPGSTDAPATAEPPPPAEDPAGDGEQPSEGESAGDEGEVSEGSAGEEGEGAAGEEPAGNEVEDEDPAPEVEEETAEEPTAELEGTSHVVAEGESLFDIAEEYGISWVDLADYNGIEDTSSVTAGMTIVIPPTAGTGGVAEEEAAPEEETTTEEPAAEGTAEETVAPTPSPAQETIYVVQPGDNLFRIGLRYGISWVQIAEANGIVNPNMIRAGQELKIPTSAPGPSPEFTHVVQPGETLFRIATRYGVSWQAVAQRNQIRPPHVIYPGQTLIIPGNGSG